MKSKRPKLAGRTPDWILEQEGLISGKPKRPFKPSIRKRIGDLIVVVAYFGLILTVVIYAFKA